MYEILEKVKESNAEIFEDSDDDLFLRCGVAEEMMRIEEEWMKYEFGELLVIYISFIEILNINTVI